MRFIHSEASTLGARDLADMIIGVLRQDKKHKDSNWQKLIEGGFDTNCVITLPVLRGLPVVETVKAFTTDIEKAFAEAYIVIGQFGIGADGHIAGILPSSKAVTYSVPVVGYESKPFTRVTISPLMLEKIDTAYVFVFGKDKKETIINLITKDLSIDKQPSQVLKKVPEVYLYSDQI